MQIYNQDPKVEFAQMTQGMSKEELEKEFGPILKLSDLIKEDSKDEPA